MKISNYLIVDARNVFYCRLLMSMEEMNEVEINNPGFYTSVCLLLDIAALPVTAVLQVIRLALD